MADASIPAFPGRKGPALDTLRQGTLRVAAFTGFAPFAWHDGHRARGRDIAFLERFAAAHELTLHVDFHGFDHLWELPERGQADIAASGISLLPGQRATPVAWSRPYSEVRRTLLIRADDRERIACLHDIAPTRLAVVARSAAHLHALETKPDTLTFCPTLEHGIEDLLLGNIDAVGTGSVSAQHHVTAHPGLDAVDVHRARPPEHIAFAVRHPLLHSLDAFIARHATEY